MIPIADWWRNQQVLANWTTSRFSLKHIARNMAVEGITLYCGNLSWSVTDDELLGHFNQECDAGSIVSATVSRFDDSGRSKGWGLVVFTSQDSANSAIEKLNGTMFGDREITLREDKGPSEPRTSVRTGEPVDDQTLFIGNLAFDCDDARLSALFSGLSVETATIQCKPDGSSKGFALVRMATPEDAQQALDTLMNVEEGGRTLAIRRDRPVARKPRNRRGGGEGAEGAAPTEEGEGGPRRRRRRNRGGGGRAAEGGEGQTGEPAEGVVEGEAGQGRRRRTRNRNRRKAPAGPALTLFVKNLPLDINSDGLRDLFQSFGAVGGVVKTTEEGTSKGFGVVTFGTEEAATAAISGVNATSVNGSDGQSYTLEVREDKQPPRAPRAPAAAPEEE